MDDNNCDTIWDYGSLLWIYSLTVGDTPSSCCYTACMTCLLYFHKSRKESHVSQRIPHFSQHIMVLGGAMSQGVLEPQSITQTWAIALVMPVQSKQQNISHIPPPTSAVLECLSLAAESVIYRPTVGNSKGIGEGLSQRLKACMNSPCYSTESCQHCVDVICMCTCILAQKEFL